MPCVHQSTRQQQWRRRRHATFAAAAAAGDAAMPSEEEEEFSFPVFPRLKESDPFKVLGIPSDSDFEEVQAAHNYLVQVRAAHCCHALCSPLIHNKAGATQLMAPGPLCVA